jgi:hypothetical protein
MKGRHLALLADKLYTVKKVRRFPVPSWNVINQTLIGPVVIKTDDQPLFNLTRGMSRCSRE